MKSCDLEANRVQELDSLIDLVKPKILLFIQNADPDSFNGSLGNYVAPADLKAIFQPFNENLETGSQDLADVGDLIDKVLQYSVNTWNPGFLDKLYASNNPIGVISDIILSVLNTNSHVYTVSPVLSVLENFIGKKYAKLFYKNETCGGLTFSGGSWSNITSLQIARSLKHPDTKLHGNQGKKFAVYTSKHCHYSVEKAAQLLGMGSNSVFKVDVNDDGTMKYTDLNDTIEKSKEQGYTPLYINATAGTTVFGSFDNFKEISKVAKTHDIWFHIDGSWGGNVIFSSAHKHFLEGCELSDSLTVNPHKMLGVPTTCSFLLLPNVGNFQKAMSLSAPYLFHGRENDEENFDLADGTMGCGRRADSFKFYMAWKYYGTKGFEQRVDHAYDIVWYFVDRIKQIAEFEVIHNPSCLQVCFYYKPPGCKDTDHTNITRYISRQLHTQGKYLVDFSPNPKGDATGEFFRVVFNSPILTSNVVDNLIEEIQSIGKEYQS
jgi:glutamate decarboxylase